jgi:4-azaleucine resistance transporter AzlC
LPQKNAVAEGIKDAVPVVLGYVPLGFAFGVLASETGLTVAEATFMSIMCFTGAGQYIALGLLAAGASPITIILANLLVNLRYALFSTSLIPYLKILPTRSAAALMLGLTDETYAVSMVYYAKKPASVPYIASLNLTSYASWVISGFSGATFGYLITDPSRFGLDFALPGMYAILLVLVITSQRHLITALIAVAVCLIMAYVFPVTLSNLSNIIVAAVVAATAGVLFKR